MSVKSQQWDAISLFFFFEEIIFFLTLIPGLKCIHFQEFPETFIGESPSAKCKTDEFVLPLVDEANSNVPVKIFCFSFVFFAYLIPGIGEIIFEQIDLAERDGRVVDEELYFFVNVLGLYLYVA